MNKKGANAKTSMSDMKMITVLDKIFLVFLDINCDANMLIHTNYTNVESDPMNVVVLVSLVFIRPPRLVRDEVEDEAGILASIYISCA